MKAGIYSIEGFAEWRFPDHYFLGFCCSWARVLVARSLPPPPRRLLRLPIRPLPRPIDASLQGRLQRDIAALSAYPSRVPGTTGNLAAADYVEKAV